MKFAEMSADSVENNKSTSDDINHEKSREKLIAKSELTSDIKELVISPEKLSERSNLLPDDQVFENINDSDMSGSESETDIPAMVTSLDDDSHSTTLNTVRPGLSSPSQHISTDLSDERPQGSDSSLDGLGMSTGVLLNNAGSNVSLPLLYL